VQGGVHPWLEEAALHAVAMGCYGSMVLAFATRVTLGHSGRPLKTTRFDELVFAIFQIGVLARVGTGLTTVWFPQMNEWIWVSGLFWLASFGLWGCRYLPMYFSARVDGQPG